MRKGKQAAVSGSEIAWIKGRAGGGSQFYPVSAGARRHAAVARVFAFMERVFRPKKNHNYSIKINKYCIAKTYDAMYS